MCSAVRMSTVLYLQNNRHRATEELYTLSKRRQDCFCSQWLWKWSSKFTFLYVSFFVCVWMAISMSSTLDTCTWILVFQTFTSLHSHPSSSFFLLSNILCHFRHKLLVIFHSSHVLLSMTQGPSQSPDTALDMAAPDGHGKTAWLLSTQQRALYKTTRISSEEPMAVNRLLCPLHKGLIQRGYPFNKAFDSVEDPWLCCDGGTQTYRLRGEYRSVCTALNSGAKFICLIPCYKGEGPVLPAISGWSVIRLLSLSHLSAECILLHTVVGKM